MSRTSCIESRNYGVSDGSGVRRNRSQIDAVRKHNLWNGTTHAFKPLPPRKTGAQMKKDVKFSKKGEMFAFTRHACS